MMRLEQLTFITGNKDKAEQIEKYLGLPVEIEDIDLTEVQDLDPSVVTRHKVLEAYKHVGKPVLVDDNGLSILGMGRLPGTLIKLFAKELKNEGLCRLADLYPDRKATAFVRIGLTDGTNTEIFSGDIPGTIAEHPRGERGFGWDGIFIPEGYSRTRAEMNEEEYDATSPRKIALERLAVFLKEE